MSLSREINHIKSNNEENNSFKRILFITIIFIFIYHLIKYLAVKSRYDFKNKRDQEGFTQEDRLRQTQQWDEFSLTKLKGEEGKLADQTELFFKAIGKKHTKEFKSSTSQIIQFGISTGDYVKNANKEQGRKAIGYDFSAVALNALKETKGLETRLINLNSIDKNHKLMYEAQLKKDFSEISDVLLIRILEYLHPEAMQLLMASLIQLAKPGSRFYIEILSPSSNLTDSSGLITVLYSLRPGTISNFFSGRNDFKIQVLPNTNNPNDKGDKTLERLLVKKI